MPAAAAGLAATTTLPSRARSTTPLGPANGAQTLLCISRGSGAAEHCLQERELPLACGAQQLRGVEVRAAPLPGVAPDGRCEEYLAQGLVALTYGEDINGSSCAIAGIQDESGRVLGLMPHPERFLIREHHYDPDWDGDDEWGWGYYFFKSIHERILHGEGAAV